MHFVTGGAFNGKRTWVKKTYKVRGAACWKSAYEDKALPAEITSMEGDLLILEGIEIWLKDLTKQYDSAKCRELWNRCLDHWNSWEKAKINRRLVVIGTDITKGIVPLEKENRLWRDVTGWAFQDLAARADQVDVIWYGINQTIKKAEL